MRAAIGPKVVMDDDESHQPLSSALLRAHDDAQPSDAQLPDAQSHGLANLGTVHVLLVEDDASQQIMLQ